MNSGEFTNMPDEASLESAIASRVITVIQHYEDHIRTESASWEIQPGMVVPEKPVERGAWRGDFFVFLQPGEAQEVVDSKWNGSIVVNRDGEAEIQKATRRNRRKINEQDITINPRFC